MRWWCGDVVQFAVCCHVQVAAREKAQKEEEERRETGRAALRTAAAKAAAAADGASALGVSGRKEMMAAVAAYEARLQEARLAEVSVHTCAAVCSM